MSVVDRIGGVAATGYWSMLGAISKSKQVRISPSLLDDLKHDIELLEKQARESDAHQAWSQWQADIRRAIASDDIRTFLTWPTVAYTMFVRYKQYTAPELKKLRTMSDFESRWKPALQEDALGAPLPYVGYPQSSANLIHHVFHIWSLEQALGTPISKIDNIIEFGGGYGSMARAFYRLGFKGQMQIFDFPELGALQRFYLSTLADADAESGGPLANVVDNVHFVNEQSELDLSHKDSSLFVAMWSLSETPTAFREGWIDAIKSCENVLIGFQRNFYDVDNKAWFVELTERMPEYNWVWRDVAKSTDQYLVGRRR